MDDLRRLARALIAVTDLVTIGIVAVTSGTSTHADGWKVAEMDAG